MNGGMQQVDSLITLVPTCSNLEELGGLSNVWGPSMECGGSAEFINRIVFLGYLGISRHPHYSFLRNLNLTYSRDGAEVTTGVPDFVEGTFEGL